MNFLEKNLEDIIFETDQTEIRERGLHDLGYTSIFRQVNLGSYGIADLITVDNGFKFDSDANRVINVCIYELKLKEINIGAVLQAVGYIKGVLRFLDRTFDISNTEVKFQIVCIGETIDKKGNFCFLPEVFDNLNIYTYSYRFDGIWFHEERGYLANNEQFPNALNGVVRNAGKSLARLQEKHKNPF